MLAALALCVLSSSVLVPGDPFSEVGFEAALEKAKKEQKLLLVDFTASWCGPCKKMEKDTWGAADVRAWLGEHALAVQIDINKEHALAERFHIEAMPTVVALRAGEEFDRFVGYRDAPKFLRWANDVLAGKRPSDAVLERSKALRESTDFQARYEVAQELQRLRQYDEALVHYLWLWPNTRHTSFTGVRVSFMLSDMAELARKHAPAKEAFDAIFAELQAKVDSAPLPSFEDWSEWTSFCDYFDVRACKIAWYERRRDAEGQLFTGQYDFLPDLIVSQVFDALLQADRPQDAVRLYGDARPRARSFVEEHRRFMQSIGEGEEEWRVDAVTYQREKLDKDMGKLHAAMLLADRHEEAADIAKLLLETLDTPESRQELVRQGLYLVKKTDPAFARWLDEAEAAGADVKGLRRKLDKLEHPKGGH